MDIETLVVGYSTFVLLGGAVLALPLSFLLLWLYRSTVIRGMDSAAGVAPAAPRPVTTAPPSRPLRITVLSRASAPTWTGAEQRPARELTVLVWRAALAYTAAGLAFAALFAGASSVQANVGIRPLPFLLLTICFAWPLVPALGQLAALGWREQVGLAALYLTAFAIAVLLIRLTNRDMVVRDPIVVWLILNGRPTVLWACFLTRRVRAVGPLVLAFMVAGVAGAVLLPQVAGDSDWVIQRLLPILAAVGLGGVQTFALFSLIGFSLLGVAGWRLLRLIGRRYQWKRMSDQSLALDAMWLLFAASHALFLASGGPAWVLIGIPAFLLYKLVLWAALAGLVRPAGRGERSPTLLVLRVFSLGARSMRLFDALAKHWLRAGPIVLIAGPDLVTGLVEPPEFLDFLGDRVSRRFVQDGDDLAQRLSQLDTRPDPDGRYRASEFFCRADTWQMTMRALAAQSDSVLMDLRSFSPANQGCLYELRQLLDGVPLARVVLVVDGTTDRPFLEERLQRLWHDAAVDSPNRALPAPEVQVFQVRSGTGAEVRALLGLLLGQLQQVPHLFR